MSFDDRRQALLERTAAAYRWLGQLGHNLLGSGHVTVRDPERADHWWVAGAGVRFVDVRVSDLVLLDPAGEIVGGSRRSVSPTAHSLHRPIHDRRPDVVAVVHTHAANSVAWSALARPLVPISQEACMFHLAHAVHDGSGTMLETVADGCRIAEDLGAHKAVFLPYHGALTVGGSIDEAVGWFVALELACETHIKAFAAGTPVPMADDVARRLAARVGRPEVARRIFEPVFEALVTTEPDLRS